MIEGRNIICIASNWFYDPTSKHHVMKILAERNHIIWVNHHGSRRPRLNTRDAGAIVSKLRQVVQGPRRVSANMTVVTPLVVPIPGNRIANRLNRRLLTRQIRRVLRSLPSRPVQLWSFAPDVDYLVGQFDEQCVVYYCVDAFSAFDGYDRDAIISAEQRLASQADLVVTTSQALYDAKRGYNPNTVLLPHGVDVEHFSPAASRDLPIPEELAALPRPILGFWGLLQDWLDVELLAKVATARPDWSLVLIGEIATDVASLKRQANVHLLGRRPYQSLPSYARGFDLGMIPFRINDLTRSVNPIKLREYLSAGLPVVSTPLPEVRQYSQWVQIAEKPNAESFVNTCNKALADVSEQYAKARYTAMRRETWLARVSELSRLVQQRENQTLRGKRDIHNLSPSITRSKQTD